MGGIVGLGGQKPGAGEVGRQFEENVTWPRGRAPPEAGTHLCLSEGVLIAPADNLKLVVWMRRQQTPPNGGQHCESCTMDHLVMCHLCNGGGSVG